MLIQELLWLNKKDHFLVVCFISMVLLFHSSDAKLRAAYCDQVLDDSSFVLVPSEHIGQDHPGLQFYEFAYTLEVFDDVCKISDEHGLTIRFIEWTAKVSDVLIHEKTFGTNQLNGINISLRSGTKSIQCNFSGKIIRLPHGKFVNFACLNSDVYQSVDGLAANAIEITAANTKSEISANLANLNAEGSFGWLFLMHPRPTIVRDNVTKVETPESYCLPPELYPGQRLSPEKQVYQLGEVVTFSCPANFVLDSRDTRRTCENNRKWSDSTPKCQPKTEQSYESIVVFSQPCALSSPAATSNNVSVVAHFNRDFHSIEEITIEFEVDFASSEWKSCFTEDENNALFHITSSNDKILKKGSLQLSEHQEKSNRKSMSISAQDLVQFPCTNCSVGVTFRNCEAPTVKTIRIVGSSFPHRSSAGLTEQCPPITPYYGMPEAYKSYELIADGSINELLLASPCREGFKFIGNENEINQCKGGTWHGSGFPECEEILLVKPPPQVEHASWFYIDGYGYRETIYICDYGYHYAMGSGKATYSIEKNEWTNVPVCQRVSFLDTIRDDNWQIIVAAIFIAAGLLCVVLLFYRCLILRYTIFRRREHDRGILSSRVRQMTYSRSTSIVLDDDEGYLEPISKPLQSTDLGHPSNFSCKILEHIYDEPPTE